MGRRSNDETPCIRVVKSTGYCQVRIGGKTYSLGRTDTGRPTTAMAARAAVLWAEYTNGVLPAPPVSRRPEGAPIATLANAFLDHAETYDRDRNGKQTSSWHGYRAALRWLQPWFNRGVSEFNPAALRSIQTRMVKARRSRSGINKTIKLIRRVFAWGVSHQIVPVEIVSAVATVEPLRRGSTDAPETAPVCEVADDTVDATLAHLGPVVSAMVQFQRVTGCRPGEVRLVRPCDIDRTGDVWVYRPKWHKTGWREGSTPRKIAIGPRGQEIIGPFLERDPNAYCFSPAESEGLRAAELRAARKTKLYPSHETRPTKKNPKRQPSERYETGSYRRAIHRAAAAAGVEPWSLDEVEDMLEFLAASCNHAEDAKKEARLDTICRKLEKLVG